ncbi:hypothetical protein K491DRAFT_739813 [Lophiostoma macrostomum CBS 122681]|uniref:Zn(2)-C6 fungal-type domain-containing protein n=1 Tax=Lophiostoma macrostomum CBS 122681 TaxID=1314788 RepID=A0A6A6TH28_9PLEO|nr:hypothetical protein K491DRAFT_739813 [Lophiostoma macrostomum CBS 122681]
MVYYGPISKGCDRCRRRKIKCGEQRPACQQCTKANIPCAGYRCLTDLVFRDETALLRNRHKFVASAVKSAAILPSAACSPSWKKQNGMLSAADHSPGSRSERPSRALLPSLHDRAAGFVFANFVYSDAPVTETFADYLKHQYVQSGTELALSSAMQALGLFGIAHTSKAGTDVLEARRVYGRSLALTREALRDPERRSTDEVLAAVWFLAMVENMTASSLDQYRSWYAHIEGAMSLISLRGKQQFDSELGRILFFKFRAQLMSLCLQRDIPMPDHAASLLLGAGSPSMEGNSALIPAASGIGICNLRAAIASETLSDPQEIIAIAQDIESAFSDMLTRTYLVSAYRTIITEEGSNDCFQGRYDIYSDLARAQSWNHLRNMSIIVNGIIADHYAILRRQATRGLMVEEEALASHAVRSIQRLCHDICGSVSYILCNLPAQIQVRNKSSEVSDALPLLWPLYTCMTSSHVSDDMRRWARGRLVYINHVFGIRQAGLMIEVADRDAYSRTKRKSASI